jgi:chemotaxis protein methyltransferase CheR
MGDLETGFFREPHHLPAFIEHLRERPADAPPALIWSAGCATGESPYAIAMALHEAGEAVSRNVRIIASDLDAAALDIARRATYPVERAATAGEMRLARFFVRCGNAACAGLAKVRPDVGAMVEFHHVDIFAGLWAYEVPFAAFFYRNALVYLRVHGKTLYQLVG